jgi:putative hydrolase of the HAD superfamily
MLKNIIFDFGGVIFTIDFLRTFKAFSDLGFEHPEQMFSQHSANELFQKLETGKISPENFYEEMKNISPNHITNEQLQNAWNAMLIGYREKSLDFLIELKQQYNLYLLSNTNEIHYDAFSKTLKETTRYNCLEDFFSKAWYSHKIHRRKPDIETFEFVLKDAGIIAEETLFIDDSFSNLPNAEKTGIKTHLLKPEERIENLDYSSY